jgi:hypothetical protein
MESALDASKSVAETLQGPVPGKSKDEAPVKMLEQLREGFSAAGASLDGADTVRLAEAIRVLSVKHGPAAVQHCIQLVESVRTLLDRITDGEASGGR